MLPAMKQVGDAAAKIAKAVLKSDAEAKSVQKGMDLMVKVTKGLERDLQLAAKFTDPKKLQAHMQKVDAQMSAMLQLQQKIQQQQQMMQAAQKVLQAQHEMMMKVVKNMK